MLFSNIKSYRSNTILQMIINFQIKCHQQSRQFIMNRFIDTLASLNFHQYLSFLISPFIFTTSRSILASWPWVSLIWTWWPETIKRVTFCFLSGKSMTHKSKKAHFNLDWCIWVTTRLYKDYALFWKSVLLFDTSCVFIW